MQEFKRILFPLDLSDTSAKLVPYVQAMAQKFDAKIHLLFVARVFDYFTSIYVPHPSINRFEKELIEGAEKKLYEFADQHFADFPGTRTAVVAGDASEEIVNYIETHGIDLVIMGTHGRKGLDKIVFGSVAERVVKTAPVPVLVINPYRVPPGNAKA
ncbi:MAG: universal stress protein [Desulfobacterales bacterium]|nr:MAG: universal stress protein [Desulfobacterales bacterium]